MVHVGKGTTIPPLPIGGASIKSGRVNGMELSKLEQFFVVSIMFQGLNTDTIKQVFNEQTLKDLNSKIDRITSGKTNEELNITALTALNKIVANFLSE